MSDTQDPAAYTWGGENFCAVDATDLYNTEPERLDTHGYPVAHDEVPESFCAVCLFWFTGPDHHHPEGSDHRPPQKGTA